MVNDFVIYVFSSTNFDFTNCINNFFSVDLVNAFQCN
ncbi:hypothetical protein CoNPh26_CDS0085 [Staphylococcus phage S-CoN_Ph26]|nr:hypothetical protein CoNPh26_CDS0085 [Staphylococcus phage S-CoN_Ph26]